MTLLLHQTKPGNLPYVTLYHGTHAYRFIVDTGSTSNWIDAKTMSNFLQEGETKISHRVINSERYAVLTATLRTEPRKYDERDDVAHKFSASFASGLMENIEQLNNNVDVEINGILGMEFLDENCISLQIKNPKKLVIKA